MGHVRSERSGGGALGRHSEQFFRVAQGLLLKRFDFPGKLPMGANFKAQVASVLSISPAIDRAWYRGAEDERDAYAVEDLVKAALRINIT